MRRIYFTLLAVCMAVIANAQTAIKLDEVSKHIDDSVIVCGKVEGLRYFESAKNSPTFLNIGGKYPNQLLTVVIWGDARKQFKDSPDNLENKEICITGRIILYKGKPEIIINQPSDITIRQ